MAIEFYKCKYFCFPPDEVKTIGRESVIKAIKSLFEKPSEREDQHNSIIKDNFEPIDINILEIEPIPNINEIIKKEDLSILNSQKKDLKPFFFAVNETMWTEIDRQFIEQINQSLTRESTSSKTQPSEIIIQITNEFQTLQKSYKSLNLFVKPEM